MGYSHVSNARVDALLSSESSILGQKVNCSRNPTEKNYPYLTHIKALSNAWPHLRLLADFMEVSTTPSRWKELGTETQGKDGKVANEEREERASRTNVTRLDYLGSGDVDEKKCENPNELIEALKEDAGESKLRLFVVEDLSRDVIEALGDNLDIEPAFFREHIVDFAWCNIRDRWQDPPNLHIAARQQRWLQLRYVTARYYKTTEEFAKGVKEAENFNVFRRLDDDSNNKAVWDDKGAIVGIIRTRASFWLRHADSGKGAVGKHVPMEECNKPPGLL
jgi:hypothetical protein